MVFAETQARPDGVRQKAYTTKRQDLKPCQSKLGVQARNEFQAHEQAEKKEKNEENANDNGRYKRQQHHLFAANLADPDLVLEHAAHEQAVIIIGGGDIGLEIMKRVRAALIREQGEESVTGAEIVITDKLNLGVVGLVFLVENGVAVFFEIDIRLAGGGPDFLEVAEEVVRWRVGDEIEAADVAVADEGIGQGGVLEARGGFAGRAG